MDERQAPGSSAYEALPAEDITIDQVVAWNMRHWRRASRVTQEELGAAIGWSAANVSAAERSVEEHRDRRRLDAQTIAAIAGALDIPIAALFLPPEDDGQGKRYRWHPNRDDPAGMTELMRLAMHDNGEKNWVMDEYRERYAASANAYAGEKWGAWAGQWFAPMDDEDARAEQAARFRSRQAALLRFAAEDAAIAEFLEGSQGER